MSYVRKRKLRACTCQPYVIMKRHNTTTWEKKSRRMLDKMLDIFTKFNQLSIFIFPHNSINNNNMQLSYMLMHVELKKINMKIKYI